MRFIVRRPPPMPTALFALLLAIVPLTGCATGPAATGATEAPATTDAPGEVDYSCRTDADCTVKNVGNCCGYYPACVNKDSPTFPDQVLAWCEKNDLMAVCGFPDIRGCTCVEGQCAAVIHSEGPVR